MIEDGRTVEDDRPLLVRGARGLDGEDRSVLLRARRIVALDAAAIAAAPNNVATLEADGLLVAPGFLDLQVNGAVGFDLTGDPSAIWRVGEALPRWGVTAWLPTIVTAPPATLEAARAVLAAGPPAGYRGATPLGLHAEGPFLAAARRGVHDPAWLRPPARRAVAGWAPTSGIRLVTLAPELPGALDVVPDLVAQGVAVAAGHSDATATGARAGFDAGIRAVTHLFNAMPPLGHRDPGLVGAALDDPRVTVGLIADGIHVDPTVLRIAWRAAGARRVAAVTDAIAALGMPDGRYRLGEADVEVRGGEARSRGRLAGSVLSLDAAARNLVELCGASPAEAIGSVTAVPARVLGLAAERGTLRPGAVGDVVLLEADLRVAATIVAGRLVHASERAASAWG